MITNYETFFYPHKRNYISWDFYIYFYKNPGYLF